MIEATFTVSEADYIDMQKAHWRGSKWKRIRLRFWLGFFSCAGLYSSYQLAKQTTADIYFLLAAIPSAVILVGVLRTTFTSTYLRKRFKGAASQLSDLHVQIDQNGYRFEVTGKTNGILYWPAFTSWIESPRVIALLRGELMYPIPKSALDAPKIDELRDLCSRNIVLS